MNDSMLTELLVNKGLITAFLFVGVVTWISYWLSTRLTRGYIHGSAIAIALGLGLAYIGGVYTGGNKGLADIAIFSGVALLGGSMLRDFAIIATAYGADLSAIKKAGWVGALSVVIGVVLSFVVGAVVAFAFGYGDAISMWSMEPVEDV